MTDMPVDRDRLREAIDVGGLLGQVKGALYKPYAVVRGDRLGEIAAVVLLIMIVISLAGPMLAPYEPMERHYNDEGAQASLEDPSIEHPLGTTMYGRDVLSQVLAGSVVSLFSGFATAAIAVVIGTAVALTAGYYGGGIDDALMRLVDVLYGIPILPFALVALSILDRSIIWIIFMLGFIYWRAPARVIRSEILSIKEEEFIQVAKTTGASSPRILYKQLLPNVLPYSFLYFAFGTAWAIITVASIEFLGFGDPGRVSWGRMIYAAWSNDGILRQPLWAIAPAIMITIVVTSVYLVARTYEVVANPQLQEENA